MLKHQVKQNLTAWLTPHNILTLIKLRLTELSLIHYL